MSVRWSAPPLLLVCLLLPLLSACGDAGARSVPADLVLRNGTVVTVDDALGTVEALAIADGRILAVGSDAEIENYVGPDTDVIDLQGRTAIPGFIEGHGHFTGMGEAMQILDLMKVESWSEVVNMVAEAAQKAEPGDWILGRGWHQEKWSQVPERTVEGFPTHHSISEVSPDNPVCLTHASGHACFFNAKAMELAGVDSETGDPPGGEILRDEGGAPSGVFRETAQGLVKRVHQQQMAKRSPEQKKEDLRRALRLADQECLRKGVTSFQDAGSSFATIDAMKEMAEAGKLGTRLWVMIRTSNADLARNLDRYRTVGAADQHLTVRAIKRTLDGALGSRGAWLLDPYADLPESTGLNTAEVDDVKETARLAADHDYQLCVHAIGDRANRETLDLYQQLFEKRPDLADHRWRIEHAQHINSADIPRFAELDVIASMQGIHCTSDAPYVMARLGAQRAAEGAYVWQKLMATGALVTNGTDAPVEDVDPIACYHATVTRKLKDGSLFYPDQKMSRMEALKSYTINAAQAAFEEGLKGTLTPGKLADVVVLSKDILSVPDDEIAETQVIYTIVGGRVLFASESGSSAGQ